jgi:hypothetical protein
MAVDRAVTKTVCAASSLSESMRTARRCASSCGIAQIRPMGTLSNLEVMVGLEDLAGVLTDHHAGRRSG